MARAQILPTSFLFAMANARQKHNNQPGGKGETKGQCLLSCHCASSSPPTQLTFFCLLFLVRNFQLIILFPSLCATTDDRRSAGTDKNKKLKVINCLLFAFVSNSLLLLLLTRLIFLLLTPLPYFSFGGWCDRRRGGKARRLITKEGRYHHDNG